MGGRQQRFEQLDLRLEAISDALYMAREEPSPERRAELLAVVERAFAAYHEEHRAALEERPRLRVIRGGAVVVACTGMAAWLREKWGTHRPVTVGAVTAAAVIGSGVLLTGMGGGATPGDPPASSPVVTAAPPRSARTAAPTETVTTTMSPIASAGVPAGTSSTLREVPDPSATGAPSPTPSPNLSPSAIVSPGPVQPSPSGAGRGRGTDTVAPPGPEEDGDEATGGEDGGAEGGDDEPDDGSSCVLEVDVPGVDAEVGRGVCL